LDVDEHFDISMLSMIQNDIVIYLGQERVPLDIIKKFVHVIRESSRLYYVDEHEMPHRDSNSRSTDTHGRTSDLMGTTGTIVPVMKESFAYAAFKLLFGLCSAEKQGRKKKAVTKKGRETYYCCRLQGGTKTDRSGLGAGVA
jgi:hypothetical protein